MKFKKNWLIPLVLTAVAGAAVLQNSLTPALPVAVTGTAIGTNARAIVFTDTPEYEGCFYTWAYHPAPELTKTFSKLVNKIEPKANAYANLYGEDCVYADGRSEFQAMETDFYARLPVEDLTDVDALGDRMAQVMQVVLNIPREEVSMNYGFVEFWFEKNDTEQEIVRVHIQKYKDEAQKKNGSELYRMFASPP